MTTKSKKSCEGKSNIAPMQYLFGIAWDLIPLLITIASCI